MRIRKLILKIRNVMDMKTNEALAISIGTTKQSITNWIAKDAIPRKMAARIQKVSDGKITIAECLALGDFREF